jgi:hypothetical protein
MQGRPEYRIKNSKQSLPRVANSMALSSLNAKQPVGHRYSDLIVKEKKDSLVNTVVEEHLIKFGYVNAFDTFLREASEKEQRSDKNKTLPNKAPISLTETKEALLKVIYF